MNNKNLSIHACSKCRNKCKTNNDMVLTDRPWELPLTSVYSDGRVFSQHLCSFGLVYEEAVIMCPQCSAPIWKKQNTIGNINDNSGKSVVLNVQCIRNNRDKIEQKVNAIINWNNDFLEDADVWPLDRVDSLLKQPLTIEQEVYCRTLSWWYFNHTNPNKAITSHQVFNLKRIIEIQHTSTAHDQLIKAGAFKALGELENAKIIAVSELLKLSSEELSSITVWKSFIALLDKEIPRISVLENYNPVNELLNMPFNDPD